jgi:hypothetical protein
VSGQEEDGQGQANLFQEEEVALLLLEWEMIHFELPPSVCGEISKVATPRSSISLAAVTGVVELSTTTMGPVHLVEERVFTQFNDVVKSEGCRWVLDSDVSNHMTDVHGVFT